MNVTARLEYELANYDSAVHRFNHYTTRTPPLNFQSVFWVYIRVNRHNIFDLLPTWKAIPTLLLIFQIISWMTQFFRVFFFFSLSYLWLSLDSLVSDSSRTLSSRLQFTYCDQLQDKSYLKARIKLLCSA